MNLEFLELGPFDMGLTLLIFIGAIWLQSLMGLKLTRDFTIAGVRMFGQLLIVGWILTEVFRMREAWVSIGIIALMVFIASHTAWVRVGNTEAGSFHPSLPPFMAAVGCGVTVASVLGIGIVLRPSPWFDPQYLIPLVGMVTGNTMNASALAAERFIGVVQKDAHLIESFLALGLSGGRILERHRRQALRAALMPTINTMMVVGIVSLPGMMTGQILAGALPSQAVRYQMLIHSLIVISAILGSFLSVHSLGKKLIINDERLAWTGGRSA